MALDQSALLDLLAQLKLTDVPAPSRGLVQVGASWTQTTTPGCTEWPRMDGSTVADFHFCGLGHCDKGPM